MLLNRAQLRQAFYFSPRDRRIVDPAGNYWWNSRKSILRVQLWKALFERNDSSGRDRDEPPYVRLTWVLRSDLGPEWMGKALYFEHPETYDSKGRPRYLSFKGKRRREASGHFLSSKNPRN